MIWEIFGHFHETGAFSDKTGPLQAFRRIGGSSFAELRECFGVKKPPQFSCGGFGVPGSDYGLPASSFAAMKALLVFSRTLFAIFVAVVTMVVNSFL